MDDFELWMSEQSDDGDYGLHYSHGYSQGGDVLFFCLELESTGQEGCKK